MPAPAAVAPRRRGRQRMLHMWRLFRREQQDPGPFDRYLASELVRDLEGRHGPLEGQRLLDLGCGPGWYAEALERLGARVIAIDYEGDELATSGDRKSVV